jgi:hypothetical protein
MKTKIEEQAAPAANTARGFVHCPICTHTVEAPITVQGRRMFVRQGERCPRCKSNLEPGVVLRLISRAA